MSNHLDQLLHDVFVTACEGGVQYWAGVSDYHWSTGDGTTEDLAGFGATLTDNEEDEQPTYELNREVMLRGYLLACGAARHKVYWNCESPIAPEYLDDEGWDHDAGDADCIAQLGLFGEVIYG